MLSYLSFSTTSDDHALFLEGDVPGDGVDNVSESLTGACVILFTCQVCSHQENKVELIKLYN